MTRGKDGVRGQRYRHSAALRTMSDIVVWTSDLAEHMNHKHIFVLPKLVTFLSRSIYIYCPYTNRYI